MINKVLLF